MKLMIEIEDRDEALEAQEELIRLEQEKTVGMRNLFPNKGRVSRCKRTCSMAK